MKRFKLVLIGMLSGIAGAAGILTLAPAQAQASESSMACSNTWCGPGDKVCIEFPGWYCTLSGGCSGANKCDKT
jgi:hypothetical protein